MREFMAERAGLSSTSRTSFDWGRRLLEAAYQNDVATDAAARKGEPAAVACQSEIKYLSGVEVSQLLWRSAIHWLAPHV